MQYACLVYVDPSKFRALDEHQLAELDEASLASNDDLRASGHLILAEALQPVTEAVTVRIRDGRMSTTTGPFAETAEHLGGAVLIEARDLNEAIGIAGRLPIARFGCIEVRPVMDVRARVMERRAG